jgi:hypothetical protein
MGRMVGGAQRHSEYFLGTAFRDYRDEFDNHLQSRVKQVTFFATS